MRMLMLMLSVMAIVSPAHAVAEPLVIYSGRSDQLLRPVMDRFTEKTGIPVLLHAGSATELLNKLRLEGSRTAADLYISNDAGTLQMGEELGLFRVISDPVLAQLPMHYRGTNGTWVGLSARARVLVVNSGAGLDWVTSVFHLADPRLKGRIGITNASNESFVAGLSVYQAVAGDARILSWLVALRENAGGQVYPRHGAVVADVAAGRRAVGLVNHYYISRYLAEHPDAPIRMVVPDQQALGMGVAWNVAGIAISTHSRRSDDAASLVAFLISEEGQRLFADANLEYPTRDGVAADPSLPAVKTLLVAAVPMPELAARRNAALDLIDRSGLH